MAVEPQRIINRFNEKFKTVALSKQKKDALAAKLAPKIADNAEDSVIDQELDDINDIAPFALVVAEDARIANAKNNPPKPPVNEPPKQDPPKADEQKQDDDPMAWFKSAFSQLNAKIEKLETEKTQATIREQFNAKAKELGISELYLKRIPLPEKAEDIDTVLTDIKKDYDDLLQVNANLKAPNTPPAKGKQLKPDGTPQEASKEEIAEITKNIMPV